MKKNKTSLFSENIYWKTANNMKIFLHLRMKSYIFFKLEQKLCKTLKNLITLHRNL